jgi:hypothetical protein
MRSDGIRKFSEQMGTWGWHFDENDGAADFIAKVLDSPLVADSFEKKVRSFKFLFSKDELDQMHNGSGHFYLLALLISLARTSPDAPFPPRLPPSYPQVYREYGQRLIEELESLPELFIPHDPNELNSMKMAKAQERDLFFIPLDKSPEHLELVHPER